MKRVSWLKAGHSNTIFTVRDVVNSSGVSVASYEFNEYARKISPTNNGGVESQKTFVGGMSVQDEVSDTGLMMMGHRFYEPDQGRFLSRDPIGLSGGFNMFEYAGGSPIATSDHLGLVPAALAPALPYLIAAGEAAIASVLVGMGIRYCMGEDPVDPVAITTDAVLGGIFAGALTLGKAATLGKGGIGMADETVRALAAESGNTLKSGATTAVGSFAGEEILAASGQRFIPGLASACTGLGNTILGAARNSANPGIYDAERKILEYLAERLSRWVIGSLNITVSKASCPTCIQAAAEFSLKFPGVTTTMVFPGGGVFLNSMLNNLALGSLTGLNNLIGGPPVQP